MSDERQMAVRVDAGWGGDRPGMSPALRMKIMAADAAEAAAEARREQEQAAVRAQLEERRIAASIEAAVARGEVVDPREAWAQGGVGRTRSEALSYYSAVMDVQDARARHQLARREQRAGRPLTGEGSTWADTTPPSWEEREADRALLDRGRGAQVRQAQMRRIAERVIATATPHQVREWRRRERVS